jgi:hydroxyethylthiazole kinase-like uncharacterized protein yjeF
MGAAARALAQRVAFRAIRRSPEAPIIALVGPGNNGGDALLAAMMLRERGFAAEAWVLDPDTVRPPDAETVLRQARSHDFPIHAFRAHAADTVTRSPDMIRAATVRDALFMDGLFGIGLRRPISGLARDCILALNEAGACVIGVDVPSGIDADTGAVVGGSSGVAVRCRETLTLIADKPGLHTGAAVDYVGEVHVDALGIDHSEADGQLVMGMSERWVAALTRSRDSHKGRHGSVRVTGGAAGMRGAALLAGLGAQRAGAGKVFIEAVDGMEVSLAEHPELMSARPDPSGLPPTACVVGCGLGQSHAAEEAVDRAIRAACPVVLDADALTLLSRRPKPTEARIHGLLMTPHPLEAARLLGTGVAEVQSNRINAALHLARMWRAHVVLKGSGSVCATPDGRWSIVARGSPALATAGTGDVLAGVIGGLLAQGLPPWDALQLGAWAHGAAAELWSQRSQAGGQLGLGASELPDWIRFTLNQDSGA